MKRLVLLSAALLTGCSTYNETFDCAPSKGVGCTSLSQVNHMVDEGVLPLSDVEKPLKSPFSKPSSDEVRIWLAGYDEEGVIHGPSVVYVPLKPQCATDLDARLRGHDRKLCFLLPDQLAEKNTEGESA